MTTLSALAIVGPVLNSIPRFERWPHRAALATRRPSASRRSGDKSLIERAKSGLIVNVKPRPEALLRIDVRRSSRLARSHAQVQLAGTGSGRRLDAVSDARELHFGRAVVDNLQVAALPRKAQIFQGTLADAIAGYRPGTGCAWISFTATGRRLPRDRRRPRRRFQASPCSGYGYNLAYAVAGRLISDFDEQ